MTKPPSPPPRVRLQALLAIPEQERTEEQWAELNELEIMLAPGNRGHAPEQDLGRKAVTPGAHPKAGGRPQLKKSRRRRHKGNAPKH
jgi:hypothetical protein